MDMDIFEMMARHFSIIYYNDIFKNANEVRNRSMDNKSLTDVYCDKLGQYLHIFKPTPGVGNNSYKYYNLMLTQVIKDYNARTGSKLNTSEYTELFIKGLVNEKFSRAMTPVQRDDFTFKTMGDLLTGYTKRIVNNLSIVIDKRCKENMASIKFMFLDEIKNIKKSLYDDLIKVMTNNKNTKSVGVNEKLQKRLKEVYSKLAESQKKYNSLVSITRELRRENTSLKDQLKQINIDINRSKIVHPNRKPTNKKIDEEVADNDEEESSEDEVPTKTISKGSVVIRTRSAVKTVEEKPVTKPKSTIITNANEGKVEVVTPKSRKSLASSSKTLPTLVTDDEDESSGEEDDSEDGEEDGVENGEANGDKNGEEDEDEESNGSGSGEEESSGEEDSEEDDSKEDKKSRTKQEKNRSDEDNLLKELEESYY